MRKVSTLISVLAAGTMLLAGCGGQPAAGPADTGVASAAPVMAEVAGVRPGPAEDTFVVDLSLPAGKPGCARDPKATNVTEEGETIFASFVYSPGYSYDTLRVCAEKTTVPVTVKVSRPVGTRTLSLNSIPGSRWTQEAGAFRRCHDTLGCKPPADHCDPLWIDLVVGTMDVPVKRIRGVRTVRGCEQNWLVFDLNPAAGDCPPAEGAATACSVPSRTRRVYLRWDSNGWKEFATGKSAGCADALGTEPAFPARLCENLPAVT
ncbi:hypothetical protein [Longispora albida]|uniref:hypothetical protein n=1 Tax=Longispora albida TaxID=203523 RepID=UPI00035FF943|nr:hypothetical protein [Longispora albida]